MNPIFRPDRVPRVAVGTETSRRRARGRGAFLPLLRGSGCIAGAVMGLVVGNAGAESQAASPADREISTEELKELSLEQLMELEVSTVYGASRFEQRTTEAPSSVSIVSVDDIKRQGHRTLADILNTVRGFYVTYDRGYSYIGARGFNRPGDYGGRMLLMVDGHRLNDGVYDTAASGTDFLLDVDLIDRVEIIRGPGSSLYGNNAFFGVINVITRRGRDLQGGEASASYGSFDTVTGRLTFGKRFDNGAEVLLSGSLLDSAGQERLEFPEFTARDLDGGQSGSGYASLAYGDFTLSGGYVRRTKDWPTAAYGSVPDSQDPRLFSLDQRAYADLKYQREFGGEWLVTARGYFDRYQYDADYPFDSGDPSSGPTVNRDLAVATSAGIDLSVNRTLWETHRITLGGEWRHDFELRQRNWDVDPEVTYAESDRSADILGVFAQDEWSLRPDLIVNAGLRYDSYSSFGDTVNPRAGLIYTPWEPATFKFLYGQAFRAPNAYERYYEGSGARANPGLRPETIRSYEVIWEQRIGRSWRTGVSAFWNDVDGLIDQQWEPGADPVSPIDDIFYFDNVGGAVARGLEFEVEGRLPGGLRALASYAFTDTEDQASGLRLNNSPEHLGKLNLSMPVWREKVFAGFELQAMSGRQAPGGAESGAYAIANFTIFSRELVRGLEFSATLHNLFDQRYSHPVSADFYYTGPVSGQPILLDTVRQDGRTFRLKFTYRF